MVTARSRDMLYSFYCFLYVYHIYNYPFCTWDCPSAKRGMIIRDCYPSDMRAVFWVLNDQLLSLLFENGSDKGFFTCVTATVPITLTSIWYLNLSKGINSVGSGPQFIPARILINSIFEEGQYSPIGKLTAWTKKHESYHLFSPRNLSIKKGFQNRETKWKAYTEMITVSENPLYLAQIIAAKNAGFYIIEAIWMENEIRLQNSERDGFFFLIQTLRQRRLYPDFRIKTLVWEVCQGK